MEGIRRALVLGLVLIVGPAIEQDPSIGPHEKVSSCASNNDSFLRNSAMIL